MVQQWLITTSEIGSEQWKYQVMHNQKITAQVSTPCPGWAYIACTASQIKTGLGMSLHAAVTQPHCRVDVPSD